MNSKDGQRDRFKMDRRIGKMDRWTGKIQRRTRKRDRWIGKIERRTSKRDRWIGKIERRQVRWIDGQERGRRTGTRDRGTVKMDRGKLGTMYKIITCGLYEAALDTGIYCT